MNKPPAPTGFTADVDIDGRPRLKLKLSNGWTVSLVMRQLARHPDGAVDYDAAFLAAWPTLQTLDNPQMEHRESEASADEAAAFIAEIAARPTGLPDDVVRLVLAARHVAFGGLFDSTDPDKAEAIRELDRASEAFAARVPWENEPEEADA